MTSNLSPTPRERQFLRAIAAINPMRKAGEEWWSADHLRSTPLFPDFRYAPVLTLAGFGKSCTRKGMAVSRRIGTRGHGWTEWRISGYGRGLVSDSCIGGGLAWREDGPEPGCPACGISAHALGLVPPWTDEIPAHGLPGYITTATGETR